MSKHVALTKTPRVTIRPDRAHKAIWRGERWLQVRSYEGRACKLCGQMEDIHAKSGMFSG